MALKSHVEGAPSPDIRLVVNRMRSRSSPLAAADSQDVIRTASTTRALPGTRPPSLPSQTSSAIRRRLAERQPDDARNPNSQRAPMRCRDAGLGLQVATRVETAACRRSERSPAPRFDGRSRLPGSARQRVPESVGRRPLSLAAVERPSQTLRPRPSRVRRQTSRTMTTMTTTTAMAAMPMLRVVMGASQGLEHRARRNGARAARTLPGVGTRFPEPR